MKAFELSFYKTGIGGNAVQRLCLVCTFLLYQQTYYYPISTISTHDFSLTTTQLRKTRECGVHDIYCRCLATRSEWCSMT